MEMTGPSLYVTLVHAALAYRMLQYVRRQNIVEHLPSNPGIPEWPDDIR